MEDALRSKIVTAVRVAGLTLPRAAEACGIDYSTFIAVYYGRTKRPGPGVLHSLEGLGLSYEELALAAYGIVQ